MSDIAENLLLVDDDDTFRMVLSRAFKRRGFNVCDAPSVVSALATLKQQIPDYAIVDLNMPDESGLSLVQKLHQQVPECRILVLTAYASISTAVEAIKLGATHYLTKPADADEIITAMQQHGGNPDIEICEQPMSVRRLEWEHIQKILQECDGNVSEAARRLNMHRRTLQRKLQKRPVSN